MAIREGRWDCSTCGTRGIRGRFTVCESCGTPRPDEVRFYLPANEQEVTDAGLLRQATAGADWICEHCGASTRALQDACSGCGAPRGSSKSQETYEYGEGELPPTSTPEPVRVVSAPPPSTRRNRRGRFIRWGLGAAGIAGIVAIATPEKVPATVTDRTWERTVAVERYRTVEEEGWSLPEGGREIRHWQDVHHHEQVFDHYETRTRQVSEQVPSGTETYVCGTVDHGNGYFSDRECTRTTYTTQYHTETYQEPVYRSEPVYATRYRYEIERWMPERTARAAGREGEEPKWPDPGLKRQEREGRRGEVYTLTFVDEEGKVYTRQVPRDVWDRHRRGQQVTLRVYSGGEFEIVVPDSVAATKP
ncbi:MAG TPA: Ran-binding zinc finger domain-containing protein [Longimicrobiaceae bacterium]|nr:Ran-binding zinc finger domain-containing protein [Longimicrobiaceae bacterium]